MFLRYPRTDKPNLWGWDEACSVGCYLETSPLDATTASLPEIKMDYFTSVSVCESMITCVCVYLFPGLIYEGAAFPKIRGDVSLREVQDLQRLVNQLIWEQVRDSVGHIQHMWHLTGGRKDTWDSLGKWPREHWLVFNDCFGLEKDILSAVLMTWHQPECDWARWGGRGETDEEEKEGERGETGQKTDGSNSFYSVCLLSVKSNLAQGTKLSPALHLSFMSCF